MQIICITDVSGDKNYMKLKLEWHFSNYRQIGRPGTCGVNSDRVPQPRGIEIKMSFQLDDLVLPTSYSPSWKKHFLCSSLGYRTVPILPTYPESPRLTVSVFSKVILSPESLCPTVAQEQESKKRSLVRCFFCLFSVGVDRVAVIKEKPRDKKKKHPKKNLMIARWN